MVDEAVDGIVDTLVSIKNEELITSRGEKEITTTI